jgi:hypothetical protein
MLAPLGYKPYRYEADSAKLVPFYGETVNTFYLASRDQHVASR